MKRLLFIFLTIALLGCRSQKPVASEQKERIVTNREVIETLRDTMIYVSDSASILALVKCDSAGQAYLSEIQALRLGKLMQPSITLSNSQLTVDCKVDSAAIYLTWHERFEQINTDTSVSKTEVIQVNYVTKWQLTQMWFGRIFMVSILILIALFFKLYLQSHGYLLS